MRISGKWVILGSMAIAAGLGAIYWWWAGGSAAVRQLLTPRFRVVRIDLGAQTMELRQANRTYTVRCGEACREFVAGGNYPAVERGSDLEIGVGRRRVGCPIIKIEVRFDVHPGGVGSWVWRGQKHSGRVPY